MHALQAAALELAPKTPQGIMALVSRHSPSTLPIPSLPSQLPMLLEICATHQACSPTFVT